MLVRTGQSHHSDCLIYEYYYTVVWYSPQNRQSIKAQRDAQVWILSVNILILFHVDTFSKTTMFFRHLKKNRVTLMFISFFFTQYDDFNTVKCKSVLRQVVSRVFNDTHSIWRENKRESSRRKSVCFSLPFCLNIFWQHQWSQTTFVLVWFFYTTFGWWWI